MISYLIYVVIKIIFKHQCTHYWIVGLGCSKNIDVVYIDFIKAFDSIIFSKSLFKLQNCGISGILLARLSSFIHGRSQCVVLVYHRV